MFDDRQLHVLDHTPDPSARHQGRGEDEVRAQPPAQEHRGPLPRDALPVARVSHGGLYVKCGVKSGNQKSASSCRGHVCQQGGVSPGLGPTRRRILQYRVTSLVRKFTPLGPYLRPMPRVLAGSKGGGRF